MAAQISLGPDETRDRVSLRSKVVSANSPLLREPLTQGDLVPMQIMIRVETRYLFIVISQSSSSSSSFVLVRVLVLYSWSEVIHKPGSKAFFLAFERERPRIVNNFAASALSGYEFSSSSEEDELIETFEPGGCCLSRQRILRSGRIVSEAITSRYKEFASVSGRANDRTPRLLESPLEYE
jgi:hypothetical protein